MYMQLSKISQIIW